MPSARSRLLGAAVVLLSIVLLVMVWLQFRGELRSTTPLTMIAARSGLVTDPGAKVTYNGVPIGRVTEVVEVERDQRTVAHLHLEVDTRYMDLLPVNVHAVITASTVFGSKYVELAQPAHPTPARITPADVIEASSVTTEINTVFETINEISEKVDVVKLNATLAATAEALTGLGTELGSALVGANEILGEVNPRLPQLTTDIWKFTDVANLYTRVSPDLWSGLDSAIVTVRTLTEQQQNLDASLSAAIGFGNTTAEVLERTQPFLVRGFADYLPTAELLDYYSPQFVCLLRNFHGLAEDIKLATIDGYSVRTTTRPLGAENPYVFPDNLPRVAARGGPGGAPGCWHPVTKDLWPAPYLVIDTGASIAPYDHFAGGRPLASEYVWGRQIGEHTVNP